ncbi:MAG: STAS domain-containing protein, partial [Phycisphaerae bacterium]|nr:STAS domain-containing protein [Phycisphaerae bacterium]
RFLSMGLFPWKDNRINDLKIFRNLHSTNIDMLEIRLPRQLDFSSLMRVMASMHSMTQGQDIVVNFRELKFVRPAGIASLAALMDSWLRDGRRILIQDAPKCMPFSYLQRMNFFNLFKVYEDEDFKRHTEKGRFASMKEIVLGSDTKRISTGLANSICGGERFQQARSDLDNCLYESINNIIDHSGIRDERCGFAVAQSYRYSPGDREYVISIADSGRGIRESLSENSRLNIPDDKEALRLAVMPGVTGAIGKKNEYGDPRNVGQGLHQIDMITQSVGGIFSLHSGNALRLRRAGKVDIRPMQFSWHGTVIIVTIHYSGIRKYNDTVLKPQQRRIRLGQ